MHFGTQKHLIRWQFHANLTSKGEPLGECPLILHNMKSIDENFQKLSHNDLQAPPMMPASATPPESRLEVGRTLVEHNQWYTKRFGTAQIHIPVDWYMDPFKSRSWVWLFHQFDFFRDLILYERDNGGRKGYDMALKVAFNWWSEFANPTNSPDFAWHDHGSANRARNMLLLREGLRDAKIRTSERTDRFFDDFFTTHANFLADTTKYSKGTNHGLDQSIALFTLAAENKALAWADEYAALAQQRLEFELTRSFEKDGGHNENSVHYQEFGIRQAIKALRLQKKYKFISSAAMRGLKEDLERSSQALVYMVAPNGKLPSIGDTEYQKYPNILSSFADLPSYDSYLYAISAGKEGTPPTAPDLILPQSGWAALRSGWTDENDLHLLTKCAFNSHYHRHDDDTSFVLHAHGEEWITDGGLYKYAEKDPMRIHLRSRYAHSLSAPDGVEPVRNIETHGRRNRIEDYRSSDDSAWMEMISHMFPGYVSQRRITLERPACAISISDRLVPLDGASASSSCTTRFLVPKDKTVAIEGSNVRIEGAGHSLLICPDQRPDHIAVASGQTEPELRGWQSRTFNTIDPAHSIEFHYTGGELDVTYQLNFV